MSQKCTFEAPHKTWVFFCYEPLLHQRDGYVLRVYNSHAQELVKGIGIGRALTYLKSRGFTCPAPVASREGYTDLTLFEAQILLQDITESLTLYILY